MLQSKVKVNLKNQSKQNRIVVKHNVYFALILQN